VTSSLISVVMPAKNEAETIGRVIASIQTQLPGAEIIVVDDGSDDHTGQLAASAGANVIHHAYSLGNGGAIKAGARAAKGEIIVFMDADGQHDGTAIKRLLDKVDKGFDMAVGARTDSSQAGHGRRWANRIYNWFASYMTGQKIPDLTSGFRAVRAAKFREFLYLLPNGFSYPTTITMAFFRAGYQVAYVPFTAGSRKGKSHINPIRDGIRFSLDHFQDRQPVLAFEAVCPDRIFAWRARHLLLRIYIPFRGSVVSRHNILVDGRGDRISDWAGLGADHSVDVPGPPQGALTP
jgi:glycosyltransferase involved in cell wall biosynthesis